MTENNKKKAYLVSYPRFVYPIEVQIVWAETPSKAKYAVMGEADAEWVDLRVNRRNSLDDHEYEFYNDNRFKNLWYLNNDFYVDVWELPDGTEVDMWEGDWGSVNGDTIREVLELSFNYDIPLTYDNVDQYARAVLREKEEHDSIKS